MTPHDQDHAQAPPSLLPGHERGAYHWSPASAAAGAEYETHAAAMEQGEGYRNAGAVAKARAAFEAAIALAPTLGDRARASMGLAWTEFRARESARMEAAVHEAHQSARDAGDPALTDLALYALSECYLERPGAQEAGRALRDSLIVESGDPLVRALALGSLAARDAETLPVAQAADLLRYALRHLDAVPMSGAAAWLALARAEQAVRSTDPHALPLAEDARERMRTSRDTMGMVRAAVVAARAYLVAGRLDDAEFHATCAYAEASYIRESVSARRALEVLGDVMTARGEAQGAARCQARVAVLTEDEAGHGAARAALARLERATTSEAQVLPFTPAGRSVARRSGSLLRGSRPTLPRR